MKEKDMVAITSILIACLAGFVLGNMGYTIAALIVLIPASCLSFYGLLYS